jgi:iodotyrosine deiodinase
MTAGRYVSLDSYEEYPAQEMKQRAVSFRADMQRRRSVRDFSDRPVPRELIEECVRAAASAPSGANMQPWHFVAVSDPGTKKRIREAAEKEEYEFYHGRAGEEWLGVLSPLGTNYQKPFLETAPYLIAIFARTYGVLPDGRQVKHYYVRESVGIATGILLTAIHHAGLAVLPYTPSRPGFLNGILGRPRNERPFLVLVVGYPAEGALVPDIHRKTLNEVATFV